jgi:tetratricopeptide (TPR) repeat protein
MKYTCVGCGAEFEADPQDKLRCPKCLRQHGLEPETSETEADAEGDEAPARPAAVPGRSLGARYAVGGAVLVAAAIALVGALLAVRRAEQLPAESTSDEQLRKAVVARGVASEDVVLPFGVDPGIVALARDHAKGAGPLERGQALAQAVRQLIDQSKAVRWRRQRLPEEPPRRAVDLLSALHSPNPGDVRSYEAAALVLAAARAAGLHALLAEVHKQGGRYADPSGSIGAYAVAVYGAAPAPGQQPLGYVDAFGDGSIDEATPLDDLTAVAGYFVLRSLAHAGGHGDTAAAYRDADLAVKLAPASPLPQVARGQALIAGGGASEAITELRQAAAKRDDAPRHTNLAAAYIAAQEPEQAEASLRAAIQRDAGFGPARLALAAILTMRRDDQAAQAELDAVERIDPTLVGLRLVRAQIQARKGDLAAAEKEVRAEMEADPGDERAGLMLFGLLKGQAKDTEADSLKESLLKRSRHADRLRQIFDAAEGRAPGRGAGPGAGGGGP